MNLLVLSGNTQNANQGLKSLTDLAATIGGPYNTLKIDKGSRLPMEDVTDDEDPSIMDTDINGITEDTSTKRQCSPTSSVSGPQKRLKVTGGRPPVARKITWDLDSDDGRMVALKDKGLTDQEVADRLRAEGRVDYHPKTISSRYRRIQRALEVQRERELDNGTCSWQGSDDELLKAAVIAVDKEIEALKTKADENKWIYVSRHLKTLLPHSRYSSGACKKRYYAFKAATVNVPVDEASGHDEGETNPHPDINQASFGTFVDSNFEFLLDKHSTSLGTGEALKDDNADQRLRK
ncbi:MAG: hypothetical protein M1837_005958 [Sclerophora amabilis]|nr:MAG: hypothetical protein M1837_005958 [Sclerophora amabilis]